MSDAVPLTQPVPTSDAAPGPFSARMLNEFGYCPRLCYLEWLQGEFADSADTFGFGQFLAVGEIK